MMFGNLDYWGAQDKSEYLKGEKWMEWQENNKDIVKNLKGDWAKLRQFLYANLSVWEEGMQIDLSEFKNDVGLTGYKDKYFDAYVNHYSKWLNSYISYLDEKRSDLTEDDLTNIFVDQVAVKGTFRQPEEYDLVSNYLVDGQRMYMGPTVALSLGEIKHQQIDDNVFIGGQVTLVDPENKVFHLDGKYECSLSGFWEGCKKDYPDDYEQLLYYLDGEDVMFAGTYDSMRDVVNVKGYVQVRRWDEDGEVGHVDQHLFGDW